MQNSISFTIFFFFLFFFSDNIDFFATKYLPSGTKLNFVYKMHRPTIVSQTLI